MGSLNFEDAEVKKKLNKLEMNKDSLKQIRKCIRNIKDAQMDAGAHPNEQEFLNFLGNEKNVESLASKHFLSYCVSPILKLLKKI